MTNTPYDDVFRTLLNDCTNLVFPVINEVFGEHYSGQEKITFYPNEHFLNRQDGEQVERITDTCFIVQGDTIKKYHWECQSNEDNSMLIRIFEYDAQIALDDGEIVENTLTVKFPHSAVLYLRHGEKSPEHMRIHIETPEGDVYYKIPVLKIQKYTLEEIFEKNLLFLLPFYIFSHENRFAEYTKDEQKLNQLKEEYEKIRYRLAKLCYNKSIDEYTKCTIMDMSSKVVEHIAQKYEKVREGVRSVMCGKVLEYEAKTIRNEGLSQGLSQGILEGRSQGRLETCLELVRDGLLTTEEAANRLNKTIEEIESLL